MSTGQKNYWDEQKAIWDEERYKERTRRAASHPLVLTVEDLLADTTQSNFYKAFEELGKIPASRPAALVKTHLETARLLHDERNVDQQDVDEDLVRALVWAKEATK